ncbi:unnamed protein product [Caenorhabditis auriculariae]|uniref:Uncharacterized protein n=1 Tax=Caenorhabditis auriculariae TaxID=2777116 RepID=A0A8S1GSF0_9PELO|nr:unnamed protein product [Caenorhabditis auriculariae]
MSSNESEWTITRVLDVKTTINANQKVTKKFLVKWQPSWVSQENISDGSLWFKCTIVGMADNDKNAKVVRRLPAANFSDFDYVVKFDYYNSSSSSANPTVESSAMKIMDYESLVAEYAKEFLDYLKDTADSRVVVVEYSNDEKMPSTSGESQASHQMEENTPRRSSRRL